jgi:hypothetical protein
LTSVGSRGGIAPVSNVSDTDLLQILRGLGWEPRVLGDKTWRCTLQGQAGTIRLVARYAGAWVYLSILPFFDRDSVKPWGAGTYPAGFLGRLLAVNRNLALVKFALDDDGDVVLTTELPTESLQRGELETAARLLVQTTEQYRGPVREALFEAAHAAEQAPKNG